MFIAERDLLASDVIAKLTGGQDWQGIPDRAAIEPGRFGE